METSALLLIASLGSIAVLLMLYIYIFTFEHKIFLVFWFVGWAIIACNYCLDAFLPDLLRQNKSVFLLSLCLYFYANLLIALGTMIFLKARVTIVHILLIGTAWLLLFALLIARNESDLRMIQFTYLSVFGLSSVVGIVMIKSVKKFGKFILVLGLLNIAWVGNSIISSYILKIPQMAPYIASQIILLLNAIGLIQLYFKEQKDTIRQGLDYISYLTLHDGLTGLYNKSYFDNQLQMMDENKDCLPISLIVGDMNGLKFVNDVFGHREGDNWLKRMAHIIQQFCREQDIVARWGGDEYAVILPNTDHATALEIRDKIYEACNHFQDAEILLSVSLGVATKTDCDISLSAVLKEAEDLMYQDKLIEGKKARWAITEALGKVLQTNEYETKGHLERMEALAREFARILEFSKENVNNLVRATMLHDIGKIGIPKDIILKQSSLNASEWVIMKRHVEIGYRITQASGEFANLSDIILCHHEWWNGQGYPQGLKEEEIPLMSRIISILDAYDVMTQEQHYKHAVTKEEALQELQLKAGTQFDPSLVPLFIGMMNHNNE